ncbi:heparan-sulfate lyase [Chitinophaga eiseniae]|uniref:Heparan-sulfate lyase n=1 Tax=Chitinophaga eiseniae TaxID=634771 RepID=A0A1T4TSS6_9BACT|nr:heparin-sulfate lyase HepC [Chitinophaga eiseniae]SKA43490.1 heparan-sulfate lyase [Chitinophaga eiseniae]
MARFIKTLLPLLSVLLLAGQLHLTAQSDTSVFSRLDLDRKGMEKVKASWLKKDYHEAAVQLLAYYRQRKDVHHPEVEATGAVPMPDAEERKKAEDGLKHVFFAHKGYKPYFYGDDINWQLWPVKDNELRWQLHRMYWWEPMGQMYRATGDEQYAKAWASQYLDWIVKNPKGLSPENDRFAWRPLEISHRVESQTAQFQYFLHSPAFTPEFLLAFLRNYYAHADYIVHHYSGKGNHLLFEAQRIVTAGTFFPEYRDAAAWRASGTGILNKEIGVQVYPDGLQFELSFNYHIAAIQIFCRALEILQINGIDDQFPASYKATVENMIMAVTEFTFPDYTYPMFSDAKLEKKSGLLRNFKGWAKVFPHNEVIRYFATGFKKGMPPAHESNALKDGGIYIFRNGWTPDATMMVLKASPPAFWHSQPDNGTFELYIHGRNFFPDAGCYVYGGDEAVMKERNWFRQTKVHNTLTLNNADMEVNAKRLQWSTSPKLDQLVYENPSYKGLTHRRSVYFVEKRFFVIIDEAIGDATGEVALHYGFKEGPTTADQQTLKVTTNFNDHNNVLLQCFPAQPATMAKEDSYVSYAYRQKESRDAYAFQSAKQDGKTLRFITVIYPVSGKAPVIQAALKTADENRVSATVTIDHQSYELGYNLKP